MTDRRDLREGRGLESSWRPLRVEGLDRPRPRLPDTPFARLGIVHALSAGGDALTTIALAKTLFFVSPDQARSKVLLYLLLTLAPFAIVSPFIGPLIDRYASQARWLLFASATARAVLCLLLSQDVNGPLLFPEAFALLVISKGYAIARSSYVPSVVADHNDLVRANSRLALIAAISGALIAIPGGLLSLVGARWVLSLATIAFGIAAFFATRLTVSGRVSKQRTTDNQPERRTARTPARMRPSPAQQAASHQQTPDEREAAKRRRIELRLATVAMSLQRAFVGLVTFLVAFTLKRSAESDSWLAVMGAAGIAGGLLGSLLAPRARDVFDESRILLTGLIVVIVTSLFSAVKSAPLPSSVGVLGVTFAAGISRLAFDALVQRDRSAERGSSFAKLETRFQLAWVLGALIPVALEISRWVGFSLMAAIGAVGAAIVLGGENSLRHIDTAIEAGASRWRRPARPRGDDWKRPDSSDIDGGWTDDVWDENS